MQQFIRCARTGALYPVSRVCSIEPVARQGAHPFRAVIEGEHNTVAAYLYDHDVDELQASYVPAAPGQRVFEASYSEGANGEDEIWCCEVPVVAWRIERGDVEPVGPEGRIGYMACNSLWLMMCPDGRVINPHVGTYDNLESALEALKGDFKTRVRKLQNAG
jgi:hypothetical protein